MAFSFGTQNKPAFGSSTAGTTGGFNFGTSSSGFGTGTGTNTATGTGFGATAASGATGFGFGGAAKPAASGFGGFGTSTSTGLSTGFSGFGTTAPTSSSSFGGFTGFGTSTATTSSNFGGFNFNAPKTTVASGFGSTLFTAQPAQDAGNDLANMAMAVSMTSIYGDERDAILAKWNQIQAFWGSGKGYYNQAGNCVEFKPENPFCRFKAVGYSIMPATRNRDGIVAIIFSKAVAEVQANQQNVVDILQKLLGSKPNLAVCVDNVKELPDNTSEMQMYIQERLANGTMRRIPALEVFNALNAQAAQLKTHLSVLNILPKTAMTKDQLKTYLAAPPSGIDPLIWQQAILDNPNQEKYIPVPMVGFTELHNRLKHQETQTKLQQSRLNMIASDIATLQRNHNNMLAKIEENKRRHLELSHRVLQVLVKQEVARKMGLAIQADEEHLRVQLEALQAELNAPTQFKGRLNELMSQMRMQNQIGAARGDATYQIEAPVQQEIKQHLKQQQEGIQHLINIIKEDLEDLEVIEQGLSDSRALRS